MRKSFKISAIKCCAMEKERLMDVLRACDYCTQSLDERSQCYKLAAKESGRRAKECMGG